MNWIKTFRKKLCQVEQHNNSFYFSSSFLYFHTKLWYNIPMFLSASTMTSHCYTCAKVQVEVHVHVQVVGMYVIIRTHLWERTHNTQSR